MKILDIGCGARKFVSSSPTDTVIGLDFYKLPGVDVIHDLSKFPYPFESNEFDIVNASHVLEHMDDVGKVVNEVWRILKPGGIFKVASPHFSSYMAFGDVTHRRFFGAFSFDPWLDKKEFALVGGHHVSGEVNRKILFRLKKRYCDCSKFWFFAAPIASKFPKFFEGSFVRNLFPMATIYFELEALK